MTVDNQLLLAPTITIWPPQGAKPPDMKDRSHVVPCRPDTARHGPAQRRDPDPLDEFLVGLGD
jgi:hypothetical protein